MDFKNVLLCLFSPHKNIPSESSICYHCLTRKCSKIRLQLHQCFKMLLHSSFQNFSSNSHLSKKLHHWYLNCLFIQFVKGFEWVLWEHSMKASWKQSHTAKKDEPTNTHLQPWACYLFWAMFRKRHQVEITVKKKKRTELLREVTDNWQHPLDPEAASILERWLRLEVGWKRRNRSVS